MIGSRSAFSQMLFHAAGIIVALLLHASALRAQVPAPNDKTTAAIISGRVITKDGAPISDARVAVTRMGAERVSQTRPHVEGNGTFRTDALEPGLYFVSAGAAGYVSDPLQGSSTYYHPGDSVTLTLVKGGVITGVVKDSNGEPLIATLVRATRVRDQEGRVIQLPAGSRDRLTDDRGVYRLYGLTPGSYVVSAGGPGGAGRDGPPTAFEKDSPTYAPSSTRDTAVEVTLNSVDELTVDIQYRGEPGHAISGRVTGTIKYEGQSLGSAAISLIDARSRTEIGSTTSLSYNRFAFAFFGVPDGEYELYASQTGPTGELMSPPQRVKVQGADVTELLLAVSALATIDGRVIIESDPKAPCGKRPSSALLETMMFARRYEPERKTSTSAKDPVRVDVPLRFQSLSNQAFVDARGTFTVRNLPAGAYRIEPREPASGWYVRSITLDPVAKNPNLPRDGLTLTSGEHTSGLSVTITEGAAKLSGHISTSERQSLSPLVRVYLAPAERDAAENILRFYEARTEANGSFAFDDIAPGKYWIVMRPAELNDQASTKSVRQDATLRAKIVQEAGALKKALTLKPCEEVSDFSLPYVAPVSP
ncbi:MAG TPA: carboxypeptidase-like regulatory domain-containing protein [Pyrinomonadaceae bacterium]|nr:carboxypeptidase-like regulatory domain-containing protein [Pyrinomonadaceae bacterium]